MLSSICVVNCWYCQDVALELQLKNSRSDDDKMVVLEKQILL